MKAGFKAPDLSDHIYFKNNHYKPVSHNFFDDVKHLIGYFGRTKKMGFVVLAGMLLDGVGDFLNLTGFESLSGSGHPGFATPFDFSFGSSLPQGTNFLLRTPICCPEVLNCCSEHQFCSSELQNCCSELLNCLCESQNCCSEHQ